jgi:acetyl-CoA carboxylase carboxyltransferase component
MSWKPELDELRRREALAREMGGAEKVERQRSQGKLTVRERIAALVDADSFHEIGTISGKARYSESGELEAFQPANHIFGRARIDGRPVVVAGDDFTVRGGAGDASIYLKFMMGERMANELRLPLIRLIDGTGGGGSVKSLDARNARTYVPMNPGWEIAVDNLAQVPVVALGLGPVAGLGAARLVTSHYSLLVEGLAQMFVAGPPVVKRVGQDLTKEELGGASIHARNGAVDDAVASEEEAFERARGFLSYLPPSVHELPPRGACDDPVDRCDDALLEIVPRDQRKVYKMRHILESVLDRGSFFEMGARWGRSAITGLARLDGWPVAVLANDPYHYAGAWTADAAQKVSRFVELAQTFHLPVVHFVDNRAQVFRRRGGGALERVPTPVPLRLAVRRLGFVARCRGSRSGV